MMKTIKLFTTDYNLHPIYDRHASSKNGQIIDIYEKVVIDVQYHNGYPCFNLKWGPIEKIYDTSQFVYECFYGVVPRNGVIKNITGDKGRRCLRNLKLVSRIIDFTNSIHSMIYILRIYMVISLISTKNHASKERMIMVIYM